ncbi:MAG: ATP-binding protein [Gaiellaceae bacterium]
MRELSAALPTGTVTFLFTDVEGSTRLLHELGGGYAQVLVEHRRVLREAFASHNGVEVDTQGDAFFVAFSKASDALAAAADGRDALAAGPVRVRIGVHTGEPLVTDEGYVGIDVHRAARIAAAGHGGQVLVSQSTRELVGGDGLRDLGEHRLKDMAAPERIYQLGEGDFPPLKSLNNSNLPLPAEPLVGRKKELADVLRLLRDSCRLVTVTGPGGTGKTRFALEAASELIESFRDGVWWIGLAPVRDEQLVLPTIARSVGVKDDLLGELRGKELLLLLDNFEHVVDAATEIAELQSACPGVAAIVTSREPLHIAGEREYPLAPLPESPAVELFRQRAEAVAPRFDADYVVLVEICDRLDRLPLAIELAAARTKTVAVDELLPKLEQRLPLLTSRRRDVDERQRTLRATIEWSYDLLDEDDKKLFAALSVFVGSFDAAAAEAVCGADLDALESLLDKSLLHRRSDGRFYMLETIREYATALLDTSAAALELRERHLGHYLDVVIAAEQELAGEHWVATLDAVIPDENNIRSALAFACDEGDAERALMLAGSNWRFWSLRAQLGEGLQWYERALALEGESSAKARARATYGLGEVELSSGHYDRARVLLEEALAVLKSTDDDRWVLSGMNHLANAHLGAGNTAAARTLYEETVLLARAMKNERAVTITTGNLGYLALVEGRDADAEALLTEAYELERRWNPRRVPDTGNLALLSLRRGDLQRAREWVVMSLESYAAMQTEVGAFEALLLAAIVVGDLHRLAQASVRLQSAGRALAEARGYSLSAMELAAADDALQRARAALSEEAFAEEWNRGRALSLDAALALALQSLH